MTSRRQDLLLGLVVLAFIALALATVVFIYPTLGGRMRPLVLHFDHDAGLAPLKSGSPVLLSGSIEVGKVIAVSRETFPTDDDRQPEKLMIIVHAEIEADLELFDDCFITTDQPPVGGGGVVVILSVGSPDRKLLTEADIVQGRAAQSFVSVIGGLSRRLLGSGGLLDQIERLLDGEHEGTLMYKLYTSLDHVNKMTFALQSQLDPEDEQALLRKLHRVFDNLVGTTEAVLSEVRAADDASMVAKLHTLLDRLDVGLNEATLLLQENRPAIRSTVDSLAHVAETMDAELLERLKSELDRDNPDALLGKLHASMDRVVGSLENLRAITETGRIAIVGNKPAIDRTIENAKAMSEQLKLASDEIRLAPWRLLYRPSHRESDEMSIFEAARTFAEAATYLDDAAARLEAVVAVTPQDGLAADAEVARILTALRAAFERFEKAEDYLWNQMK